MAKKFDFRTAFTNNRVTIVKGLAQPDPVVDSLLASNIIDPGMADAVYAETEREKKTRKMLDILYYRGDTAVRCLHTAFLDTSNAELAKLLSPYVIKIEGNENLRSPTNWPPAIEEQNEMVNDNVIQITDLQHPDFIHNYTSIEVYMLRKQIRGRAFIINNVNFEESDRLKMRRGSDYDAENLEKLFCELHFEVVVGKDLTAKGMLEFLQEERDKVNWNEMECVILVIMSHGEITGVYGRDGAITPLKKLTEVFDSDNCPGLNEKPRLVFVQSCRSFSEKAPGKKSVDVEEEMTKLDISDDLAAVPSKMTQSLPKTIHSEAHFLIAYATPEGNKSYRHVDTGSWFLNAVVWTFKYHAYNTDINGLMTKVNRLVDLGRNATGDMRTVSECINRLTKPFFFFPGVYDDPPKFVK